MHFDLCLPRRGISTEEENPQEYFKTYILFSTMNHAR